MAGCSSTSRLNIPSLGLGSEQGDNADFATTSALPVPEESVYSQGAPGDARLQRAALPPPTYSPAPRPAQAYVEPQAKAAMAFRSSGSSVPTTCPTGVFPKGRSSFSPA